MLSYSKNLTITGPSVAPQSTQSAHGIPTAIPLGVPRRVGSIPLPAQTTKQVVFWLYFTVEKNV